MRPQPLYGGSADPAVPRVGENGGWPVVAHQNAVGGGEVGILERALGGELPYYVVVPEEESQICLSYLFIF